MERLTQTYKLHNDPLVFLNTGILKLYVGLFLTNPILKSLIQLKRMEEPGIF